MENENIYQTKYDNNLRQISSLNWLPWIGKNYDTQELKLLVVGESHYASGVHEQKYNNKQYTRIIHKETAVKRNYYDIKVYANFHRALFRNDNFDSEKFWNKTAYYNFIQRAMLSNTARPTNEDYKNGWQNFIEISKILEPDICIFLGTTSARYFWKTMKQLKITYVTPKNHQKISNTIPKTAKVISNEKKIKLIFIKHPSQYFSWSKWNIFLKSEMPKYFVW